MIQKIIDILNYTEAWYENDLGFMVGCFEWTIQEENTVSWLLNELGIDGIIKPYNFYKRHLILSYKDYQTLKNICQNYQKNADLISVNSLTGRYAVYNDLTDDDWDVFQNSIYVKYHNETVLPPQTKSDKIHSEIYAKNLVSYVRHHLPSCRMANRIIHELTGFYRKFGHLFEMPKIVIDMSPDAVLELEKKHVKGLFQRKNRNLTIKLHSFTFFRNQNFISVLFHELRHVLQNMHGLFIPAIQDNISSSCQDVIRFITTEAEAKAYTILIEPSSRFIAEDLNKIHEINILTELQTQNQILPIQKNCSSVQKLANIKAYVQAKSEERSIQTLCDIFLASTRKEAYSNLNKNNVYLSPSIFDEIMQHIENWKNFYYNYMSKLFVPDELFGTKNDECESLLTERRWQEKTGLKLYLKPSVIFSKEVARNIGIYKSIYGCEESVKTKHVNLYYSYRKVTKNTFLYAKKSFEEDYFQDVFNVYDEIQKENPYFPPVDVMQIQKKSSKKIAQFILDAISGMIHNETPSQILTKLGYELEDKFTAQNVCISEQMESQKNLINLIKYKNDLEKTKS